jgi:uncharacterized protein YjbJ (UPF0337 family)
LDAHGHDPDLGQRTRTSDATIDEESTMNKDTFKGQWKQFRGSVKKAWGNLTDDDLDRVDGDYDRFVGTVQERYGHAREDVEKRIDELFGDKK